MYEVTFCVDGIVRKAFFTSDNTIDIFNMLMFRYATTNIQIISVFMK